MSPSSMRSKTSITSPFSRRVFRKKQSSFPIGSAQIQSCRWSHSRLSLHLNPLQLLHPPLPPHQGLRQSRVKSNNLSPSLHPHLMLPSLQLHRRLLQFQHRFHLPTSLQPPPPPPRSLCLSYLNLRWFPHNRQLRHLRRRLSSHHWHRSPHNQRLYQFL
jgi:hypothetical protein